jgi:hypothetical protein
MTSLPLLLWLGRETLERLERKARKAEALGGKACQEDREVLATRSFRREES